MIVVTIVAVTLAISPAFMVSVGLILMMALLLNLLLPPSRFRQVPDHETTNEREILSPRIGLSICGGLLLFAIGLPFVQHWIYLTLGWYLQLWLVPQLLCYIASLVLLKFVQLDAHDRYECRVIVTVLYMALIPPVVVGVFIWDLSAGVYTLSN